MVASSSISLKPLNKGFQGRLTIGVLDTAFVTTNTQIYVYKLIIHVYIFWKTEFGCGRFHFGYVFCTYVSCLWLMTFNICLETMLYQVFAASFHHLSWILLNPTWFLHFQLTACIYVYVHIHQLSSTHSILLTTSI